MKSCPIFNVRLLPRNLVLPLIIVVGGQLTLAPKTGLAFHGATLAAWHNTWHGPNAFETPLRPYFIPRLPGHCDRAAFAESSEYVNSNGDTVPAEDRVDYPAPCPAADPLSVCTSCLNVRSERLGQIPNDLDSATTMSVGAPGR
jgi:hypothetical protein